MSLSERLKAMLKLRNFSQGELARRVGVTQGTIYKLVSGHALSSKKIVEIAQALDVRAEWLLSGQGDQFIAGRGNSANNSGLDEFTVEGQGLSLIEPYLSPNDGEAFIPLLPDIESAFSVSPFPLTSYDGPTMSIAEKDLQKFDVNKNVNNLVALSITGDSMDPVLPEGTNVIINNSEKRIIDGKIYAVDQSGWLRIRVLYRSGPFELTLKSYNSDNYPDEKIAITDVDILGRIVYSERFF